MNLKRKLRRPYESLVDQYVEFMSFLGMGSLPDFIIIGAQKGGTTTVYRHLVRHPQIIGAARKEVQFFSLNYQRGLRWYRAWFPPAIQRRLHAMQVGRPVITGEASPYYLAHPTTPERMAASVPHVKLIALLRNPIDRLISHYHHMVRLGREPLSLRDAVAREDDRLAGEEDKITASAAHPTYVHATYSYRTRGKYIDQLEGFARYFDRSQMLILRSEAFFQDPQGSLQRILQFLDLNPHEFKGIRAINVGNYRKDNDAGLRQELQHFYKPYNERLYEFVGEDYGW